MLPASLGYGAVFGNDWCFSAWPENWKQFNITILEFYRIVLSVTLGNSLCYLLLLEDPLP